MGERLRIDQALVEAGLAESRSQAQRLVMAGEVWLGDRRFAKPSERLLRSELARLEVRRAHGGFVGRGAEKLAPALARVGWRLAGATCLDVGASTGGFTELLLAHGAARVWAVDVGYGQLHPRLRADARVVVRERTNFRHWDPEAAGCRVDYAVMDVSFISTRLLLDPLWRALRPGGRALVLVKPQFELGRAYVGKGGVVRDPAHVLEAVVRVQAAAVARGFALGVVVPAGLAGRKGNREVFAELVRPWAGDR